MTFSRAMTLRTLAWGLALAFIFLALPPARAAEAERVLSFKVDLTVDAAGSLTVVETIGVHSEGKKIVHGITRSIPNGYHDAAGKRVALKITDVVVARDGYADGDEIFAGTNPADASSHP